MYRTIRFILDSIHRLVYTYKTKNHVSETGSIPLFYHIFDMCIVGTKVLACLLL
jgi:hypothetical protein